MARIVDQRMMTSRDELNAAQRAAALRALRQARRDNPLRRVRLSCCAMWVRDPVAQAGDRMWCERCASWTAVAELDD